MPYFDDVTLTIAVPATSGTPEDFSCDVTGALLEPEVETTTRKYLCGPKTTTGTPTWKLSLDFDQDWATDGISEFLQANSGQVGRFKIESSTLGKSATFDAPLKPGPFGGTAGELAEASIELDVNGQPTFADYTAPVVP